MYQIKGHKEHKCATCVHEKLSPEQPLGCINHYNEAIFDANKLFANRLGEIAPNIGEGLGKKIDKYTVVSQLFKTETGREELKKIIDEVYASLNDVADELRRTGLELEDRHDGTQPCFGFTMPFRVTRCPRYEADSEMLEMSDAFGGEW